MKKRCTRIPHCPQLFVSAFFLLFCIGVTNCSSKKTEVHLHDGHKFSYDIIKNYSIAQKQPLTVVLIDYHHDAGFPKPEVLSSNWLGKLILEGYVSSVYWISGHTLTGPNCESRMKWLHRYTIHYPPEEADKLTAAYTLIDFTELKKRTLPADTVISFDLDVLTVDYGNSPEEFLREAAAWITAQKTAVITAALSAPYQKTPDAAWQYMTDFVRILQTAKNGKNYIFFLETEEAEPNPEGLEEEHARSRWVNNPLVFRRYEEAFYPGASQWIFAPKMLRDFLAQHIHSGNEAAQSVIDSWKDTKRAALEASFSKEKLSELADAARTASENIFAAQKSIKAPHIPPHDAKQTLGIAVRFIGSGIDRGCLALYTGVSPEEMTHAAQYCAVQALDDPRYMPVTAKERSTLEIEISIFSEWKPIQAANCFRLGTDSVIIDGGSNKTLLQSSMARDRQYTKEAFLQSLCRKAGLPRNSWKSGQYSFYAAPTIIYREPFVQK